MKESIIIYLFSHIILAISCIIMLISIMIYVKYKRHLVFLPISIWLITNFLVAILQILIVFKFVGFTSVVVFEAINSGTSIFTSVIICFLLRDWINRPDHKELRATNDALAKAIGKLTTERIDG